MSSSDNPYAAPQESKVAKESEASDVPDYRRVIRFAGNHRPSDCWLWFQRRDILASLRSVRYGWLMGAVFVISAGIVIDQLRSHERIEPFWFFALGACLIPAWHWAWGWYTVWIIASKRATGEHYCREMRFEGAIDTLGITVAAKSVFARADWSFVSQPVLLSDRIELPNSYNSHSWILPQRFFTSADEYHDAQRLIADHVTHGAWHPERHELPQEGWAQDTDAKFGSMDEAPQWDLNHWPFESGRTRIEFVYDPARIPIRFRDVMSSVIAWSRYGFVSSLPLALSLPAWLLSDYLYFDGWSFLTATAETNVLYVGPAVGCLLYFVHDLYRRYQQTREQMMKPIHSVLTDTGHCLSRDDLVSWCRWDSAVDVVSTNSRIGWRTKEGEDFIWYRDVLDRDVSLRLEQLLLQVINQSDGDTLNDN